MVRDSKEQPFPPSHYCIHNGDQFKDEYDDHPSTLHYLIRKRGEPVASFRLVNGNAGLFEAEKYNWFDVEKAIKAKLNRSRNAVEFTRLVASKDVRGTFMTPFLLSVASLYSVENNFENMIWMTNAKSEKLYNHYGKFTSYKLLSDAPFACDEFVPNRKCIFFAKEVNSTFYYDTLLPLQLTSRVFFEKTKFKQ